MIEILTLFLGLTWGLQEVELAVEPPATGVDLTLDGQPLRYVEGPPWRTRVDLGDELGPHHLVAVARGEDGGELGRAERWINLARPPGGGKPAERTAVPVRVTGSSRLRGADEAGPWLHVEEDGRSTTATVTGVAHGATSIFTVIDLAAHPHLQRLGARLADRARVGGRPSGARTRRHRPAGGEPYELVLPEGLYRPLVDTGLRSGDRLHLVHCTLGGDDPEERSFAVSQPLGRERGGGSAWLLPHLRPGPRDGAQCLTDAVATAALWAAGSGRPRTVLLLLGPRPLDASHFQPAAVRAFLRRLRVPLTVAHVEPVDAGEGDRGVGHDRRKREEHRAAARRAWGEGVVAVDDLDDWLQLHRELRRDLARQRILWVEGLRAPDRVHLAGAPGWVRPVAGPEPRSGKEEIP